MRKELEQWLTDETPDETADRLAREISLLSENQKHEILEKLGRAFNEVEAYQSHFN
jgi:hypothetical protein